jgi:DNA-binding NarL/FixJ family response regulator
MINMPADPMRAVIADDHPVFRKGLRVLLEDLGVEVVGEAADGLEAIRISEQTRPDVVLLDLQMPGLGGIEATRRLTALMPEVRILVLTMMDDDAAVFAAIQSGALGYLLKGAGRDEIGRAMASVAAGEAVYGPQVARRVRAFFTAGAGVAAKPFPELADREREVLDLMAAGLSNPVIASRLYLSEKTVRNYVTNIFVKLGVPDRSSAIVKAREAGLGRPQ